LIHRRLTKLIIPTKGRVRGLWKAFDQALAFSFEAIAPNPMLFCGLDVYMACLIDLCKNKSSSDPEANCVSCDQRMLGNIVVNATQDITSIITFDEGPVVLTDALASEFEEKRRVPMCRSCAAVHMAAFNFVIGECANVEDAI
jgi:hypothetical protein